MIITKEEIQRIHEMDIEDVAQNVLGLEVIKHSCLCPLHGDRNPSMSFKNNRFRCWACGESGDALSLVQRALNVSFADACRTILDESGVVREYRPQGAEESKPKVFDRVYWESLLRQPVLTAEVRHFLFEERLYSPEVVNWLGISSIEHDTPFERYSMWCFRAPALVIPYYDANCRLVGVQARYLGNDPAVSRFQYPPGSRVGIYNLPILHYARGQRLAICEGTSDVMAAMSMGCTHAIAIPSCSIVSSNLPSLLQQYGIQDVVMYPDNDDAGERGWQKVQAVLSGSGINLERRQLPPQCKDLSEYYMMMRKKTA